jgi:hypothetical protein
MLCFHSHVSCNKKIVNFNLLAVLHYILPTIVSKIHAHVFLIYVHSSSFITCNFSLTVYNFKRIPFVLVFGDDRHNTPHVVTNGSLLASLGYTKYVGGSYTLAFAWVS